MFLRFIWHPSMLCFVDFQVQMLLQMHISQGFPTYSLIVRKADMEKILLSCFVTLQEVLSHMPAKSLKLKHTIKLIRELAIEIDEIEAAIKRIMDEEIQSPIFTIPGISYRMGAMIIAEIGDFSRFIPQIRYSHMQECLPPLINPDS